MKLSFDYGGMLKEFSEEIQDGTLTESSDVLILRSGKDIGSMLGKKEKAIADSLKMAETGYHPIVDWYYDDITTAKDMSPSPDDDDEDREEKKKYMAQFERDRPNLRLMKVRDVVAELQEWNRVL